MDSNTKNSEWTVVQETKPAKSSKSAKPAKARSAAEEASAFVPTPLAGETTLKLSHETITKAVQFYLNEKIFRSPVNVISVTGVGSLLFEVRLDG